MDRRSFLSTLAVGTSAVSGCLFASDGPPPGSLLIHNRTDTTQTVTVRVEKTSTESDDAGRVDQTPALDTTPLHAWEAEFTVESGQSRREEGFFTDPGAYFVEGDPREWRADLVLV